jgi:class 3 adenylate cyclase
MSKTPHKTESPPSGTVTLMFTDMSGSSRMWETFGDRFIPVWQAHDAILRDAFARFGGFEVKTEGDSFMVAFADANASLNCALFIQAALCRYPWPEDIGQPRIRIGLHTGEPFLYNNDYFGPVVNRAAHICNSAHGGQVLLSDDTRHAIGSRADPKIVFQSLGEYRLKDMGTPECLFQASHPSYDVPRCAAPRTLDSQPNNLPVQRTTFVGRAKEIEQVAAFLANGEKPVLTLTGPGGIGKTRLSLQAAAATAEWFPDGVWYVRLMDATDVESAAHEIAESMQIPLKAGDACLPQVRSYLNGRRCLLILDDANRVPEADRLIRELLSGAEGLRCLATSRESLQIAESDDLTIGGLSTQSESSMALDSDAGRLFIERAADADPAFKMSQKETRSAEDLIKKLDGVPVSIERAAQMMDSIPPSVVLDWLDQHLEPNRVPAKSPGVEKFRQILRDGAQKVYETVEERTRMSVANLGQLVQSIASVATDRHKDAEAAELGRESLRLSQEAGDNLGVAASLRQLSAVKWRNGDRQSALVLMNAATELVRRYNAPDIRTYERELEVMQALLKPEDCTDTVSAGLETAVQIAME